MNGPLNPKRQKTRADFKTILRIAKQLADTSVLRKMTDGSDYWEYLGHWNDLVVAQHVATELGQPVAESSVKHIRQQEYGLLQQSRFPPGSNVSPVALKNLYDDIEKLKTTVSINQSHQERYGQRLYDMEQHNKLLGKYRDADVLKRLDMLEAENKQLLNLINQLKLKVQHG